ncbi:hypothetical protein ACFUJY_04940 [Streptomyces sp. NPDC057249]|uniref:hypothetical protein n=1 Tax=Streptomyces sp. NPDC057249 TaxID=3346067 RepID=UPI00362BF966
MESIRSVVSFSTSPPAPCAAVRVRAAAPPSTRLLCPGDAPVGGAARIVAGRAAAAQYERGGQQHGGRPAHAPAGADPRCSSHGCPPRTGDRWRG